MNVNPKTAAAVIAVALAVGYVIPLPGGGSAPVAVHALDVAPSALAGPCEGAPQLDAATLALFFAPAVDQGAPAPVAIIDPSTFTVTYGPATYTVKLAAGGATATGPDDASAALLARHVGLCVGALTTTPQDAPGVWTTAGTYVPIGAAISGAADS